MQFTTHVQTLLDSLSVVTRALASRPARPILDGVLIEASGNTVTLTCSDGSMSIEASIESEIKKEGQTVVPGRLINDLIRRLPGGEVTIKLTDSNRLQVMCMSSRSNLTAMNASDYPEIPQLSGNIVEFRAQAGLLKRMIGGVVFSISTDENRQLLTGCLIEATGSEIRVVALDGFRLAYQSAEADTKLPDGTDHFSAVVPGRVMNEISRVLPDDDTECVLSFDRNRVSVRFGETVISSVLLVGEFIDYNRIIPKDFASEALLPRTEFMEAVERASLMAREGRNNLVKLHVDESALTLLSNADMGEIHEEITCGLTGKPIDIAFNAKYLTDAIRNIDEDEFVFCFNTNVSPAIIRPKDGKGYLYLVLPVRTF